jgi:hypothetical protein
MSPYSTRCRTKRSRAGTRALLAAALGALCWLWLPGLLGAAFGLWGFGLVLGLGVVVPDVEHEPAARCADAFEAARARALALLEEEP